MELSCCLSAMWAVQPYGIVDWPWRRQDDRKGLAMACRARTAAALESLLQGQGPRESEGEEGPARAAPLTHSPGAAAADNLAAGSWLYSWFPRHLPTLCMKLHFLTFFVPLFFSSNELIKLRRVRMQGVGGVRCSSAHLGSHKSDSPVLLSWGGSNQKLWVNTFKTLLTEGQSSCAHTLP